MTNMEKWRAFTETLEAPDLFINLGWLFTVSTSLERRVFYGSLDRPQFVNIYLLLVGDPALGKGTVMRESSRLLSEFYMRLPNGQVPVDKATGEKKRLFRSMPDTLTFERLIESMAAATKTIIYDAPNGEKRAYGHASIYFVLEELAALLRQNKSDDVGKFLLQLYDCGDYRYSTKHNGHFHIQNGCLNLVAGTQVDHFRKMNDQIGDGLLSRFVIAYGQEARQRIFDYPELTPTQKQYKLDLLNWIKNLSEVFGAITLGPGVAEYMQEWWVAEAKHLAGFGEGALKKLFARRKDQVKKLAAAFHFSESTSLTIQLPCYQRAIDFCRMLENPVSVLLAQTGKNVLYPISERLVSWLKRGPRESYEVMQFLAPEMDLLTATHTLNMLVQCKKIQLVNNRWEALTIQNDEPTILQPPDENLSSEMMPPSGDVLM